MTHFGARDQISSRLRERGWGEGMVLEGTTLNRVADYAARVHDPAWPPTCHGRHTSKLHPDTMHLFSDLRQPAVLTNSSLHLN